MEEINKEGTTKNVFDSDDDWSLNTQSKNTSFPAEGVFKRGAKAARIR